MECPNCKSKDLDLNEAGGNLACVSCGTVVEENTIVSSVEFQESGDRSHVMGQFVSANCSKPYNSATRSRGRYGNSRESRDATLAMARRNISQVAGTLRLPAIYVDKAYRLYTLALQRNFIFGRRQMHVVATCLYTICRQEKSPHLLIDFSDALQVNVYVLGKSFLQFTRLLSLALPVVDPALYIHRFSARLDLGDKMNAVSTTALRIVTRLKKDWINFGRRPDGVCAAAMLIAARSQGFHKSQEEIAKIFRISCETLRNRMDDFAATPSAQLTVEEFHQLDDANEFDPPIYVSHQIDTHGDNLELTLQDGVDVYKDVQSGDSNSEDEEEEEEEEEEGTDAAGMRVGDVKVSVPVPRLKRKMASSNKVRLVKSVQTLYDGIYAELDELLSHVPGADLDEDSGDDGDGDRDNIKRLREEAQDVMSTADLTIRGNAPLQHIPRLTDPKKAWAVDLSDRGVQVVMEKAKAEATSNAEKLRVIKDKIKSADQSKPELLEALNEQAAELEMDASQRFYELPDSGFTPMDEEINSYMMTPAESKKRMEIRERMYGDFMQERHRKKQDKATREQEAFVRANAAGKSRGKKTAGRPVAQVQRARNFASTTEPKRQSSKINYEKINETFRTESAPPAVPVVPSGVAQVFAGVRPITDPIPEEDEEDEEDEEEEEYADDDQEYL